MKEISFAEKVSRIREQVHQDLDFSAYDSTECRKVTNCFHMHLVQLPALTAFIGLVLSQGLSR